MKLRFISSALAAALFAATGSYAAVVDGGTIHFEGELVNAACSVNTDSADPGCHTRSISYRYFQCCW